MGADIDKKYNESFEHILNIISARMELGGAPVSRELARATTLSSLSQAINPKFSVLAAHTLEQRGNLRALSDLAHRCAVSTDGLASGPGPVHFDLALLANLQVSHPSRIDGRGNQETSPIGGSFPLLTRGWAYLETEDIRLPEFIRKRRVGHVVAMWTTFDADTGTEFSKALLGGEFL